MNLYKDVLYPFQKKAFNFLENKNKHMVALDMGLGKTLVALALLQNRFESMTIKKALIICQKTKIYEWEIEAKKCFKNIKILVFSSKIITINDVKKHRPRLKKENISQDQKERLKLICDGYRNKNVIIISSYALARTRSEYIAMILNSSTILRNKFCFNAMLIIDESQIAKSRHSLIGKWLEKISKEIKYISLLSGDPISNSYFDLYQQMKIMGLRWDWNKWNREFCIYERKYGYKKEWYEFIGFKQVDKLMKILKAKAYFLKTEQCLEKIPKQNFIVIRTIENFNFLSYLQKHKAINGKEYKNPIDLFLRQRQLAAGFLEENLNLDDQKISITKDLIESTNDNFIIFYNFKNENKMIKEKLKSKINNYDILEINGAINQYQLVKEKNKKRMILLIQYQAGSRGLNLENFNRMIFYSPTTSSGNHRQAIKRIHRIGQKKICFYYQLLAINSVEEKILIANKRGIDYSLKMFIKDFKLNNEKIKKLFIKKAFSKRKKERNNWLRKKHQYEENKIR